MLLWGSYNAGVWTILDYSILSNTCKGNAITPVLSVRTLTLSYLVLGPLGLFPSLSSEITSGSAKGTIGMLGMESGLATFKAITLPVVLSLWFHLSLLCRLFSVLAGDSDSFSDRYNLASNLG